MRKWRRFQSVVEQESVLRTLAAAQIAHELCHGLHEVARCTEGFGINQTVIAFVGRAKTGEFVGMRHPVELAAVDDTAADGCSLAVHVFSGGVNHDVCSPFDGAAVDGGGEGVVDDQGDTLFMCHTSEALDVANASAGVRNRFAEHQFGVGAEGSAQFFVARIEIDQRALDTHFFHRHDKQVERTAVDAVGGDEVVAAFANIEHRIEACRLTARGEHRRHTAFERSDLSRGRVASGVLQTRIEIARFFQVEESAHLLSTLILEGRTLVNGQLARFSVLRSPAGLHTLGVD